MFSALSAIFGAVIAQCGVLRLGLTARRNARVTTIIRR
jgi:hypothetical protein